MKININQDRIIEIGSHMASMQSNTWKLQFEKAAELIQALESKELCLIKDKWLWEEFNKINNSIKHIMNPVHVMCRILEEAWMDKLSFENKEVEEYFKNEVNRYDNRYKKI